jgi:hypothetical protein
MAVLSVGALLGVGFLGWVAGIFTLKRSQLWCPKHGLNLVCPDCASLGLPTKAAERR